MEHTKTQLNYYLGKLFYAVAIVDKKINPEEIETLNKTIVLNWSDPGQNSDVTSSESPKQIQQTFGQMRNIEADSETCFSEFRMFYNGHIYLFTDEIREKIWDTSQAIASSFANKNKSELILLAKLKTLLQN